MGNNPSLKCSTVVSADLKLKTGEQEWKELMKLYEPNWKPWQFTYSQQDLRKWRKLRPSCDISTACNGRLRRQYDAYVDCYSEMELC